jgi:acid phosphatase family membrane protein YuiD
VGVYLWLGALAGARVITDLSYALAVFLVWLVAGLLKFTINGIRSKQLDFGQIDYGGLPNNHSTIVSMAALIALKEGIAILPLAWRSPCPLS